MFNSTNNDNAVILMQSVILVEGTWVAPENYQDFRVWIMVFNATFNNISAISWRSVVLVEITTDLSQVTDKLYHTISSTPHYEWDLNSQSGDRHWLQR